eukprot:13122194-Alexandrium_andersonii.AAC.1
MANQPASGHPLKLGGRLAFCFRPWSVHPRMRGMELRIFLLPAVVLLDVDHVRVVEHGGPYGESHGRATGHGL